MGFSSPSAILLQWSASASKHTRSPADDATSASLLYLLSVFRAASALAARFVDLSFLIAGWRAHRARLAMRGCTYVCVQRRIPAYSFCAEA